MVDQPDEIDAEHLSRLNRKGQVVHRNQFSIKLGESCNFNHELRGRCYSLAKTHGNFKLNGRRRVFARHGARVFGPRPHWDERLAAGVV